MNGATEHEDRPVLVRQAEAGAAAWRAVVHAQRSATPMHADFYALARSLAETLAAVRSLAGVLARQVATYGDGLAAGLRVYDDSRAIDPRERLASASVQAEAIAEALGAAEWATQQFFSAISHSGAEETR